MTIASRQEAHLADFKNYIGEFTAWFLNDYIELLPRWLPTRPKEFNDPVWGTVLADAHEVAVMGSPLFQRLQDVRQLGVAHFVYRSANHTRFEHSLGALHAMAVLIREANDTAKDVLRHDAEDHEMLGTPVPRELEVQLRLAALLHDVGHGFMSHVSENAVRSSEWARDIENAAGQEIEGLDEGKKPAELAAYYMVRSKAFRKLADVLVAHYALHASASATVENVSRAILGLQISKDRPFLTEFVSGPFDVDKLDYISRDALMCGVPKVIDISRLIRKLRTTFADVDRLPDDVAARLGEGPQLRLVTGIARSGARTLDEFALARSLLTDKVYRHQKTRAFEALVASIVAILSELSTTPMRVMWEFSDSEFVYLPLTELAARAGIESDTRVTRRKLRLADGLRTRLRERTDYVAAYAWNAGLVDADALNPAIQGEAINRLREEERRSSDRSALETDIADTMRSMSEALGDELSVVEDSADLRFLIKIDPVDEQSRKRGRALLRRAFLVGKQPEPLVMFSDEFPDTEGWSDQYVVNREDSMLFAPKELATLTHLAAEVVMYRRFGIQTTPRLRQQSHVDLDELETRRADLEAARFYGDSLRALAPTPPFLRKPAGKKLVRRAAARFASYRGPGRAAGDESSSVTGRQLEGFVRQVSNPDLAEVLLRVIDKTRLLDRGSFEGALTKAIKDLSIEPNESVISVLGDPDESSAAVTYLLKPVAAQLGFRFERIDQLSLDECKTLVLVDDFIGLGTRAAGVLRGWLGLGGDTRPLPLDSQNRLRAVKVAMVFAGGLAGAEGRLRDRLSDAKIDLDVYVHDDKLPRLPIVAEEIDPTNGPLLTGELARVGEELLVRKGYARPTAKERALGYGNHGLLAVFPYSTPRQTVTALWASGGCGDGHWQALFPRGGD